MYPKEKTRLTEQSVAFGGALISEFPVGTSPAPQNFPIRNRIPSGISADVVGGRGRGIQRHAHHEGLLWNKTATSRPSRATSPTKIPGARTP